VVAKTYEEPNYGTDSPDVYKGKIDQNAAAHNLVTGQFAAHEAAAPDMTVIIDAARVSDGVSVTVVAQQTTSVITAPVTNPRIDRVVIDALTGVYSIVTGTEAVSPVAPDITAGNNACCQIALATSTTAITNSLITDERVLMNPAPQSGAWTPKLHDSSNSDAEGQTYSVQEGWYVKIGNIVHIGGRLQMSSIGTLTVINTCRIAGLPFTSSSDSGAFGHVNIFSGALLNLPSAGLALVGSISTNSSFIALNKWSVTTGTDGVRIDELSNDGLIGFTGFYFV